MSFEGNPEKTAVAVSSAAVTWPGFLVGTQLVTKCGEQPIEHIRPGDQVLVRDAGFAPVRWVGRYCADARGEAQETCAPVKIPRGALGRGQPARDLYVAPEQRIWMQDASFDLLFETREVLIPARQLIGWKGITQVTYVPTPEYVHILFDRHQVVLADGLLSESFQPEEDMMNSFEQVAQDGLLQLFPDLMDVIKTGKAARRCLEAHETPLALSAKTA